MTTTTHEYRAMRTRALRRLNEVAIANNYNRALTDDLIARADPDGWHVLTPVLLHEHAAGVSVAPHMRCQVLVAVKGDNLPALAWIDVTLDDLRALPRVDDVRPGAS